MKTIGEILRVARKDKDLTIEQLSQLTRIDVRYIRALEENNFKSLPSATFTKGFVRNLAMSLGQNPDDWIALLRRDYHIIPPRPLAGHSHRQRRFTFHSLFQSQAILLIFGALIFVGYLVFQYRAVITPPPLEISSPTQDAVVVSPLTLSGQTSSGTLVTVNDDLKLTPDRNGLFRAKLNLSPGQTEIKVFAVNRFSRSATKTISVTVVSQ